MNNRFIKWTTLAAITTAAGLVLVNNNVLADSNDTVNSNNSTQLVVQNNSTSSNVELYSDNLAQVNYAQHINFPNGYTLQAISNVNDGDKAAADNMENIARPGIAANNYQYDNNAQQESIDINNLTDDQVRQINRYALNLVNQARAQFGEQPFGQNQGTIDAVKSMTLQYQSKNESLLKGGWHDSEILGNHSENIAANQIYADTIELGQRPYATAKGSDFEDNYRVPLFTVTNMNDFQALVYYGVMGMLFNDADDYFGHAKNFLTYEQIINNMAIYPEVLPATNIASDGTPFQVKDVDVHFIWANGTEQTPTTITDGWHLSSNGQEVYFKNGQPLAGRNYIYLPSLTGVGSNWYLVDNGVAQSKVQKWYGTYYYFDPTTHLRVDNDYRQAQWGMWYMFGQDGRIVTGAYHYMGGLYYFDPSTYLRVDNTYVSVLPDGRGYLLGADGRALTGVQKWCGSYYYFDPTTYLRVDNDYRQSQWGNWYMFGQDGRIVTGLKEWYGSYYYFEPVTFLKVQNQYIIINGVRYYFDNSGIMHHA